ncbi:hypothetical protein QCA50_017200 [Cerrena zonata]|uniref:Transcription initiation factor TFIID subunit 1 histone acetyltransferase domain-containing protein n=1 Tax=Cerrena zonata TaxID=2478898 RepID=A0AAW0FHG3_9APHY
MSKEGSTDDLFNKFVSGVPDEKVLDEMFTLRETKHADDAVDYEDIDELADDDLPMDSVPEGMFDGDAKEARLQEEANDEFDGFFDNDEDHNNIFNNLNEPNQLEEDGLDMGGIFEEDHEDRKRKLDSPDLKILKKQKLSRIVKKLEANLLAKKISYFFPNFKKDKPYNNYLLTIPNPLYYSSQRPPIAFKKRIKPLIPSKLSLDVEPDQRKEFKSRNFKKFKSGILDITPNDLDFIKELSATSKSFLKQIPFLSLDGINNDKFAEFDKNLVLSTTDWDDDAIINSKKKDKVTDNLIDYDYDDENIFSGQISSDKFNLDMNDPNLLFVPEKKNKTSKAFTPKDQNLLQLKFNISNDKQYEILKNNYNTKVRSQLSNLNIEHSIPALRLQTPYYKVRLNKNSSRAFHRPKFNVRSGAVITFSKLKLRKKKKDRNRSPQEIFAQTGDLTTADTGMIIGMEYAEEYPYILSNFGMGSKLINYYRKEKEDDNSRPKAPVGETHVLGVEDRSPFWNYGYVAKDQ